MRALVTGITGQDGLYLGELLASKGYAIYGLVRSPSRVVAELVPSAVQIIGDITDPESIRSALEIAQPDEVYNLAALSSVAESWATPTRTFDVTGLAVESFLGVLRLWAGNHRAVRFYQASTSELFGSPMQGLQSEKTPFNPRAPYGMAKAFAHRTTVYYRETYGMYTACGILFNHESPRRDLHFVTRKVTRAAARISLGLQKTVELGDLSARRDWGYAPDYVHAMWRMLQQDEPDDYVIATGETHSVADLLDVAFSAVGISNWRPHVTQSERYLRKPESRQLVGDARKARSVLGWKPTTDFRETIDIMVRADLEREAAGGLAKAGSRQRQPKAD